MAPTAKRLLVRADASLRMGTGHVMRCLALAQGWQDQGGQVLFATAENPVGLEDRLAAEGFPVERLTVEAGSPEDARLTAGLAKRWEAAWVVVDGYQFSGRYQRLVKDAGPALLALDDYGHAEYYWADLILNQNPHAGETLYPNRRSGTQLLLGCRYALLRREFLKWQSWRREIATDACKVLVTLGGADPDGATLKVVQALARIEVRPLEGMVVVGAGNCHLEALQSLVAASGAPVRLASNVSDMPERMAWADVALSGAGSTCWELAFLGLPALLLVLADNQREIAAELARKGVARSMGWHAKATSAELEKAIIDLLHDAPTRRAMNAEGRRLIDGKGAARVIQAMAETSL
jgi:UDP-2,4-diacetamido-2,4,6-trideoxy-beta-L-altropyranose hydrolase